MMQACRPTGHLRAGMAENAMAAKRSARRHNRIQHADTRITMGAAPAGAARKNPALPGHLRGLGATASATDGLCKSRALCWLPSNTLEGRPEDRALVQAASREERGLANAVGPCAIAGAWQRSAARNAADDYFESKSAQAFATAVFGVVAPGVVAHPPFSMNAPRFQELAFIISTFCSPALDPFRKESTQSGARAVTTAVSEATLTASRCLPCVVHPPHKKPTAAKTTAPPTAPRPTSHALSLVLRSMTEVLFVRSFSRVIQHSTYACRPGLRFIVQDRSRSGPKPAAGASLAKQMERGHNRSGSAHCPWPNMSRDQVCRGKVCQIPGQLRVLAAVPRRAAHPFVTRRP